MTTPQPYLGLSTDRLTALINAKNNLSLQLGVDFLFGPPQAYSDSSGRNTKVVLTPINDQYEAVELHYWRLPLTSLNLLPAGYIQPVPIPQVPFKLSDILPAINAALGINLTVAEIIDQTYTTQQSTYALPINEAVSLAWLNSNYQFPATISTPNITMDQLLPTASLPGFVKPGIDMTKLAVSMPGFDKVPLSQFGWLTNLGVGKWSMLSPVSLVALNNKLWCTDGANVYGLDPIDGSVSTTLNVQGYLADSSAQATIEATDVNGLLYLSVVYGDSATGKSQMVRVDTANAIIKDGFYPKTNTTDPNLTDLYGINSTDFIYAIIPGKILKFDINSGALVQTYLKPTTFPSTVIFDPQSVIWDPANSQLWIKCLDNGAGSTGLSSTVYVCTIDGSNNLIAQTTFKLFTVWEYATLAGSAGETIYDSPDGREVAYLDQDWQGTKQFMINRYNAVTGALIASQPFNVDPRLDNTINKVVIGSPLKYNPATDEFYLRLAYGSTQPSQNASDLWAFKRKDFTQNRIVATHTANGALYDFCIDDSGTVYAETADLANSTAATAVGLLR